MFGWNTESSTGRRAVDSNLYTHYHNLINVKPAMSITAPHPHVNEGFDKVPAKGSSSNARNS